MDFFSLKRQVKEIRSGFPSPPEIARIVDLAPDGFGLLLKLSDGWYCLEIHLRPDHQGIWLSQNWEEAPVATPMGRALQRFGKDSRLTGIELVSSSSFPPDRVAGLSLTCRDRFFGSKELFHLVAELTGRVANLLLCDDAWNVLEQYRSTGNNRLKVLYHPPIPEGPPPAGSADQVAVVMAAPPASWKGRLAGFSPTMTRELAFRAAATSSTSSTSLVEKWESLTAEACGSGPVMLYQALGKVIALVPARLTHLEGMAADAMSFSTVNDAMLWTEEHGFRAKRLAAARDQARAGFTRDLDARTQLWETLRRDLENYRDADRFKRHGDLILCNLKDIPPGAPAVTLPDLESGNSVEIVLDPGKSPSRNAQTLFKLYKKAVRGVAEVKRRIGQIDGEITWLKEQIWFCENAPSVTDLMSLPRLEKRPKPGKAKKDARETREAAKRFHPLVEVDGCKFYVGRNGRQNDILTFAVAKKGDIWCHANEVPGSHVIIKHPGGEPTVQNLIIGATLAAYFSFARQSSKVAVDVTDVANVRRIPGGGTGRVSYSHQKTFYVNPGEATNLLSGQQRQG